MWNLSYTACSFVVREKYQNNEVSDLNGVFTTCVEPCQVHTGIIEVLKEYCKKHENLQDSLYSVCNSGILLSGRYR